MRFTSAFWGDSGHLLAFIAKVRIDQVTNEVSPFSPSESLTLAEASTRAPQLIVRSMNAHAM